MVAFRMACSSPLINLGAARLPPTFSSHSDTRARDSLKHLLRGLQQNYISLRWDQHRPVPSVYSHLPINALCYTLRPVVAIAKTLPLLHPHLCPIGARQQPDPRHQVLSSPQDISQGLPPPGLVTPVSSPPVIPLLTYICPAPLHRAELFHSRKDPPNAL